MIKTISKQSQMSLQNNKYHGVKHMYKMSPVTVLHLCVLYPALPAPTAVSYSAVLASS